MPTTQTTPRGSGGRPRKAEHERRVKSLRADATIAEQQHVAEQARRAGVSIGEYVRRRALGEPIVTRETRQADARLIHELNAIGVNLNQITRNVNSERLGAAGSRLEDLDALQRQLRRVLD